MHMTVKIISQSLARETGERHNDLVLLSDSIDLIDLTVIRAKPYRLLYLLQQAKGMCKTELAW